MARRRARIPLNVFMNSRLVGSLRRETSGAIDFRYDPAWLAWEHAIPVSLSLPLREDRFIGDRVLAVAGQAVATWDGLRTTIGAHPGEALAITFERGDARSELYVTPGAKGSEFEGKIRIMPAFRHEAVGFGESVALAITEPTRVVYLQIRGLVRALTGKEKAEFSGPVGIAKEVAGAVRSGVGDALKTLAILSAYLGWFNLLPFPSLDGGRLLFLGFEALSRRKPDAKLEARIHALGLMLMLALVAVVSWGDLFKK